MANGFPPKDSLDRFLDAQNAKREGYDVALSEVKAGRKSSHWMWYIFPQLRRLGQSVYAYYYGIANIDEARAYLAHKVLGHRLREITAAVLDIEGKSAEEIFGPVDAMKLRSCMTLFDLVDRFSVFRKVLDKFFDGNMDKPTIHRLLYRDRDNVDAAIMSIYGQPKGEIPDMTLVKLIEDNIERISDKFKELDYWDATFNALAIRREDRNYIYPMFPLFWYDRSYWYGELTYGWLQLSDFKLENDKWMAIVDDHRSGPPDWFYYEIENLPNFILKGVVYVTGIANQ